MQLVLERLVAKINAAAIDPKPSDNIYLEDVFTPEMYAEILAHLPTDECYDFIEHPDAVLPDGTKTRKLLDLTAQTIERLPPANQDFWRQMESIMTSPALLAAITQKFQNEITLRFGALWPEMIIVPIFYRDFPGYRIREHTDAAFKIATMQFYFPKDHSQIHLGTSFHEKKGKEFSLLKTNAFKPNSAYAFVRTNNSWHSVKQIGAYETKRDSLALTIYQKGSEYKSKKEYT